MKTCLNTAPLRSKSFLFLPHSLLIWVPSFFLQNTKNPHAVLIISVLFTSLIVYKRVRSCCWIESLVERDSGMNKWVKELLRGQSTYEDESSGHPFRPSAYLQQSSGYWLSAWVNTEHLGHREIKKLRRTSSHCLRGWCKANGW